MTPGVKLKYAAGPGQYGLNFPASAYVDEGVRLIRTTDLAGGTLASEVTGIYVPEDAVDDTDRLSPGDLLLSRSGTIGRAFLAPEATDGMAFAGFLVRFRPGPDADGRFLFYCTQSAEFQAVVERDAISSTIQNFNADRYNNLEVPLPGLDEQRAIAKYLDRETARIDTLIEEQQRLIEMLRGRRLDLVRSEVLGDTNPFDAPAGALTAIGHHYTVTLGKMLDGGRAPRDGDVCLPYIRAGNIQDDGLHLGDVNEMPFSPSDTTTLNLLAGDLLVVEGGAVGTNVVVREDMPGWSFQKTINRLRPTGDASASWLGYVLRVYRDIGVIDIVCNKSTIPHLTAEKLRGLRVPDVEPDEQRRVASLLDDETSRIDRLIRETERFIALSRERRAALITAAVTGQTDVREVA